MSAATSSSFFVLRMRPSGRSSVSPGSPLHERHDGDARLESRQAERELRKHEQRCSDHHQSGCPCCANSAARQPCSSSGCGQDQAQAGHDHDRVQHEVDRDDDDREADHFAEPAHEHGAKHEQQRERHEHRDAASSAASSGFSIRCAVASAADSVIVMTKLVAANPSRMRTTALPFQRGKSASSIRMLP